jgi:hypothetical protein
MFIKNTKTFIGFFILFLSPLLFPLRALAQAARPAPIVAAPWCGAFIPCPAAPNTTTIIGRLLQYINPLLVLSSTVCVAFLVFGGYTYLMSSGDEERARRAKRIILFSIIGIIIIGVSGVAVNVFINLVSNPVTPVTF